MINMKLLEVVSPPYINQYILLVTTNMISSRKKYYCFSGENYANFSLEVIFQCKLLEVERGAVSNQQLF